MGSIINDPQTYALWQKAQTENEWATTRLWEYILKTQVFKGRNWAISSQQPPGEQEGNQRRVDIVVEKWEEDEGRWMQWMFIEAKLAGATPEDMQSAEQQAFTASVAYTHYYDVARVCSMTCFGGKAKIWYYNGTDYLEPFVPPESAGIAVREEYIDVHSTDGYQILIGLEYIREHRVPAPTLQSTSTPSPPYGMASRESSSRVRSEEGMLPLMRHDQLYWVETWQIDTDIYFRADGQKHRSHVTDWHQGEIDFQGQRTPILFKEGGQSSGGLLWCTYQLSSLAGDPKRKGKARH